MNKVISLLGPTASGKTDLAIHLSKKFDFDIISVDSVMLYKEFNIGSAKPDRETLLKFPHKMIDILNPLEKYSVARFYNDLIENIKNSHSLGKTPLLVGGSMMYFKTYFSGGLSDAKEVSSAVKEHVRNMMQEYSLDYLHNFLKDIDGCSAEKIHFNDRYRIGRMLEIFFSNNEKPSIILNKCSENVQYFQNLNLSIMPSDRAFIHDSIEKRLNEMIHRGLVDEVAQLLEKYKCSEMSAMSTIGYKQVSGYLQGDLSLDDMHKNILSATRQLAKRQITWLRHLDSTTVYSFVDYDNIEKRVKFFLGERI
tara:strand:+ start:3427 stop:4353 length:927 start_codon:yes stop_codon:yes gene_type:complete